MFSFNLKDPPFTVFNLVAMPIRWMKKGFVNLSVNHHAKVMWDTLHRAGHEIEELQTTTVCLEKELTAWNVFAPIVKRTIEDFTKYKSDREYKTDYPYGFPETPEAKKTRHERAINAKMRRHIKDSYFVIPGHTFGTISQGALALKDVFRCQLSDVEWHMVLKYVIMEHCAK